MVYVTSHVGPHPMHRALVSGVGADVGRVDHYLRSIDVVRPKWQQYLGWFVNGFAMPRRDEYELFVLEGFQIPPMLMKWMRRIDRRRQKVVCHHTAEQLYFLQTGFYSPKVDWVMRRVIQGYDAHIVVGKEQERLLLEVLDGKPARVYNTYCTHVGAEKWARFSSLTPGTATKRMLFVGNIYGYWRVHYKGLDLLLDAFDRAVRRDPELRLTLVGVQEPDYQRLVAKLPASTVERIELVPFAKDLAPFIERSSLLVMPTRGDAFPTVVLETAAGGIVPLLSDKTGNQEVARAIDPRLVVPLDAEALAERMAWWFALAPEERERLSARARVEAEHYTEDKGLARFHATLTAIQRDLLGGASSR